MPAAGLRWLARFAPTELTGSPSFRPALDLLFTTERRKAFAATTGFELDSLSQGLIAGFDLGTLYLAELPTATAARARALFDRRQLRGASARTPDAGITVLSGIAGATPIALVTLDERVVAYGAGDPQLCRIVEAFALGKLKARTAFQGAALRGLDPRPRLAPVSVHVPGPFTERWQEAAGGLGSVATALTAQLTPKGDAHALLELTLHGDFSQPGAAERLRATYMSVAQSSTGALLDLGSASQVEVEQTDETIRLRVVLPLTRLAQGIHSATSGDLEEILRLSPTPGLPPPPT